MPIHIGYKVEQHDGCGKYKTLCGRYMLVCEDNEQYPDEGFIIKDINKYHHSEICFKCRKENQNEKI